jgi:hypothetical protein
LFTGRGLPFFSVFPYLTNISCAATKFYVATLYCFLEEFMDVALTGSLSSVPNGKIIEFEKAELRHLPSHDSLYLWVKGRMLVEGFDAKLAPRIYYERPEYWGIEVAAIASPPTAANDGANDGAGVGDALMFECSIPLIGVTGSKGVTVIGANQIKRIEIAGESF